MTITLERSAAPARHRIDAVAYFRMAEVGILAPDDRVELIDGEIIDMAPIGHGHSYSVSRLTKATVTASGDEAVVNIQSPLRLGLDSVPEPDVALLRPPEGRYRDRTPTAADVLLLIEVAQTSYEYDSTIKVPLYARHDSPEVWIVDLIGRAVDVHREPRDGVYLQHERLEKGHVTATLLPGLSIDVAALLA